MKSRRPVNSDVRRIADQVPGARTHSHFFLERTLAHRRYTIDPKFEDGYFKLAAMHASLKQFDEAIAALKKLLELNPQLEDAKAMLRQIEKERKRK